MTKNSKTISEKLLNKASLLRKKRNEACRYGLISLQQYYNYEILKIAKKLKVSYYSIA